MENAKLIYFLRHLSGKDLKQFKLFVASPLFNERESLKRLLDVLIDGFISDSGNLSKSEVYKLVYPDKGFNESSLKTNMSQLLALLRDFLSYNQFKKDPSAQNLFFLRGLNAMGENKYFPNYHQQSVKDLGKKELDTGEYQHQLMELVLEYHTFARRMPGGTSKDHMKAAVEHLGNSFLIRMLRNQIRALTRASIFQEDHQIEIIDTVLGFIQQNLSQLPEVIQVYYHVYEALQQPNNLGYFSVAKSMLFLSGEQFSFLEKNELYTCILNLATRQLNNGHQNFLAVIFDLYERMLSMKLLQDGKKVMAVHFKNMVNVGCRLGKFDWVANFIDDWKTRITPNHAGNALHFNLGTLYYYKKDFEEAERSFNQVLDDYKDVFYGLNARGYLLQIYYETGNSLGLESLTHSFRMFLNRHKDISPQKQQMYLAFINHLRKLGSIPLQDVERLLQLANEIKEKRSKGMGSAWILRKIDELVGEKVS